MSWDYMTVTLGGGDELWTALASVTVGTLGGHWKQAWEGDAEEFVGGHLEHLGASRREPTLPLYPMGTIAGTSAHTQHDVYDMLYCVLRQKKVWFMAVSDSDPGAALVCASFPTQFAVRGISEEMVPAEATKKVTLNLAFVDPE